MKHTICAKRSLTLSKTLFYPKNYLVSSAIIDTTNADIQAQATLLKDDDCVATIQNCFAFVRDEIPHCWDIRDQARANVVTLTAVEVLHHKTGLCYAKSHLLAALLRANDIPTALCYQRFIIDPEQPEKGSFLHGLNAVWLEAGTHYSEGWYRLDARGNKPGVNAQFHPPQEQLAYDTTHTLEGIFPDYYTEPLACVVDKLRKHNDIFELSEDLPDQALVQS
ncbi:transglutaminase family protein [Candidatus Haliotispira prima]|uniref:Transglutaminase family protein n=1 Tax=Candidatus Haliotispira prima TaxID=3034016 RepID=A0ABY8MJP8_9SPIO|nr:transglutaminase family protein [Candidatus Haliotispira prima]